MKTYVALLRGINVGGNNKIKMAELIPCLEKLGLSKVSTYIQSGNVLFNSNESDTNKLAHNITKAIKDQFNCEVGTVVISKERWQKIIDAAPKEWGKDPEWKHNMIVMLEPYDMEQTIKAIGVLKPEIEKVVSGEGVIYQSLSWKDFGKTTSGKLASNPIYKRMTVRNYNTAQKLRKLLEEK